MEEVRENLRACFEKIHDAPVTVTTSEEATSLGEGWGLVLIPLVLSWRLSGLSARSASALTGLVLSGVGLLEAAAPSLARAATRTTGAPRATVVFLSLLAALLTAACGLGLWLRVASPRSDWRSVLARR